MMRKTRTTMALLSACLLLPSAAPAGKLSTSGDASDKASSTVRPIDYSRFGKFQDVGTPKFKYVITDKSGLAEAAGSGVYPNDGNLVADAEYQKLLKDKKLEGSLDKFRPEINPKLAYYKWLSQKGAQNQGLRLHGIARSMELMGREWDAVKAYHAIVVHHPKAVVWQEMGPWYIGVSALDAVHRLVEEHPEWGLTLRGAEVRIQNGFDKKGTNDIFIVNPGEWVARAEEESVRAKASGSRTVYQRGSVKFVRWKNGDWQFLVHDRPFIIRGVSYFPTPVGKSPDFGYQAHSEWMNADDNRNKRIDGPYDSWVDANKNNKRDAGEAAVGDFRLLADVGANTIRLYHQAVNKPLLRDLSDTYGIRVLMGDLVGAYTVGSGANWEDGTNYADREQRERMRESVRLMVETHRGEDYVLMWVLGNENNYGNGNNARKDPQTYYRFLNSLARMIHVLDPTRPVAICNGDIENLDLIAKECPDVDVLAVNAYRGPHGMGESFWTSIKSIWNKGVLISEFGCPAFNRAQTAAEAEKTQSDYLVSNWKDIESHAAGSKTGNSLGGVLFEFMDEWWKAGPQYDASIQDKTPQTRGAFHDGWIYEEWLGLVTNGDGEHSPFLRQLRPSYTAFKNGPWREPMNFLETEAFDARRRMGNSREN